MKQEYIIVHNQFVKDEEHMIFMEPVYQKRIPYLKTLLKILYYIKFVL